jgi:hypothetical protein
VVVEMKSVDRRESALQRPSLLRCPACLLIQDCTLKDFRCTLARCPHTFVNIKPPNGSQPVSPCETTKIVTLSERRDTAKRKTIDFGAQRDRRDAEKYRLKEAQQLMDDFEKAKGRAATSIEELTEWAAERKGGS